MPSSSPVVPARAAPWTHRAKRWLYIVHRWVGIVTCLFFAIWFISGLVMVYVPFPSLGKGERLAGLAPIDWSQVMAQPGRLTSGGDLPKSISLEMRGDMPVWRIEPWDGARRTHSARDGAAAGAAGAAEARRIARGFGGADVTEIERVDRDQWTVGSGFDSHRPLWKASLAGPGGRALYVSSTSGAVVLDTSRDERLWNWLGSIPHWIYPAVLREHNGVWRQVVMWVSGPCLIGAIAGMWIGILRVRPGRRRFKGGRVTPYAGWMKWHHVTGLVGGIAIIAWMFSGWLSVDPFRAFASGGVGATARQAYAGAGPLPAIDLTMLAARARDAKRVEISSTSAQPRPLARM